MSEVEFADKLIERAERENKPFKGKDAWKKRQPRCPKCDALLKGGRRTVRVREFRDREFETCLKEDCKPTDHLYQGKSKIYKCTKCKSPDLYAAHPAETKIHIRCKCVIDDEEQEHWNMMAAQVHMMRTHGLDRRAWVQYLIDSLRPIAVPMKAGQKVIVIGPPVPDSA